MIFEGFKPAAFTFFRGLAKNNTKAWFESRREIYEAEVREPMKALVDEMDTRFGAVRARDHRRSAPGDLPDQP